MKTPINFDAIRVNSAPEILVEQIIKQIKSGKLKPGVVLPSQRELARVFEVGLGTVREAVKILNVMGYLQVKPGKGTFVSEQGWKKGKESFPVGKAMEAASLAELMKAREVVECGAARMAEESLGETERTLLELLSPDRSTHFDQLLDILVAGWNCPPCSFHSTCFIPDVTSDAVPSMSAI